MPVREIFELDVPILGICYGMQLLAHFLSGKVDNAAKREYGQATLKILDDSDLFLGLNAATSVWMSHGDALKKIPEDFEVIAKTANSPIAAIRSRNKKIFGVQFHPEVHHSVDGMIILENFVRNICKCKENWDEKSIINTQIAKIRETVGNSNVICALSGGVDSTVAAVLLHKAIGKQLHCIHIDTGLMRKNESSIIYKLFRENFNIPIEVIDGTNAFLSRLYGIAEPETKRKIIGNTFIELFEEAAKKIDGVKFLAQGTLYPDVIESVSVKGPSATIKSHHNVGGLPEKMNLKLIEPFRELFKDEVRAVGREMNIPEWFIERHPFPGPGLAIRIIGEITDEKLNILREADEIFIQEIKNSGIYNAIWQAFVVLLSVKSVGVMGDERTYENVAAIRAVTSTDGMTADWFEFPHNILKRISNRIINEVQGINRVVYDISSKPPSTIEWE